MVRNFTLNKRSIKICDLIDGSIVDIIYYYGGKPSENNAKDQESISQY